MLKFNLITLFLLLLFITSSLPSAAESFDVGRPQTEEQLRKANLAPPEKPDCVDTEEGLTLKLVKGVWNYGKCLLVSVPQINRSILTLGELVDGELESQDLKTANLQKLKEYEDSCETILGNIRLHEVMVHDYAEKSLFFGKTSPVLESHEPIKSSIIDQIARINRKQSELAAKSDIGDDFATSQIRKNDGPNFERMLNLHKLLWKGSAKYREIITAINESGEKVALLDKEEAIKLYKQKSKQSAIDALNSFKFRAQWASDIKAAIFLKPEGTHDADLGSTMAFELTNGYQDDRFKQVNRLAYDGAYDNKSIANLQNRVEIGAQQYAYDLERIENEGRTIHDTIINEAIKAELIDVNWHWSEGVSAPEHERIYHNLILTEYGQSHMQYYKDHYTQKVAPYLEVKRKENLTERMRRLSEKQRSN